MRLKIFVLTLILFSSSAFAESARQMVVDMHMVNENGIGNSIGTITLIDSDTGLVFAPKLTGLPPGQRGFHVHENPDCASGEKDGKQVAALKAGGHFDPEKTGQHLGPQGSGHKGDLPPLKVGPDGAATETITAARLKLDNLMGKSLIIHGGGDNFSDSPAPLGGGGPRIACGVIK